MPDGNPFAWIRHEFAILPRQFFVEVRDHDQTLLGGITPKVFSLGGRLRVLDSNGTAVCESKGNWEERNYDYVKECGAIVARIRNESCDSSAFSLSYSDGFEWENSNWLLVLAATLCVDMILPPFWRRSRLDEA